MNLISKTPQGGELWQGDRYDVEAPTTKPDVVVLMAVELVSEPALQPKVLLKRYKKVIYAPIDDAGVSIELVRLVCEVSGCLVAHLLNGRRVLVTCNQGRNRSGLVSALTLMQLGLDADRAISTVRHARKDALTNQAFVALLRGQLAAR